MALVDVARLQDLQRGDQLGARELGAALVGIGERRQRTDDVAHDLVVLEDLAVVRLHRPDGEHDVAVDAVASLDFVEPWLVLLRHGAANRDRLLMHPVVEIVPDRSGEFGLVACLLDDLRVGLGDAAKCAVVSRFGDAALRGGRAEACDPPLETGIGIGRSGRNQDRQRQAGRRHRTSDAFCGRANEHHYPPVQNIERAFYMRGLAISLP